MSRITPSPTMTRGKLDTKLLISRSFFNLSEDASSISTLCLLRERERERVKDPSEEEGNSAEHTEDEETNQY